MSIIKYEGDLTKYSGQILISWFLTDPNCPTAYSIGIVEIEDSKRLFYKWDNFNGSNIWLLSYIDDEFLFLGYNYNSILLNSILRASIYFKSYTGDKNFLSRIPHIVFTSDDPLIKSIFNELLQIFLAEEDWGKELYYVDKFSYNFIARHTEQFREIFESVKYQPYTPNEKIEYYLMKYIGKKEFDCWIPNMYASQTLNLSLFDRGLESISKPNYNFNALYIFSQMWIEAYDYSNFSSSPDLFGHNIIQLQTCLDFFEKFNLPLLPKEYDEAFIRTKMKLG